MGKRVGDYLMQLRRQNGLTIRQVCTLVGLSHTHLSMLERGRREASINTLYPLMQALNGDFINALRLLALDAGVPEEDVSQ